MAKVTQDTNKIRRFRCHQCFLCFEPIETNHLNTPQDVDRLERIPWAVNELPDSHPVLFR